MPFDKLKLYKVIRWVCEGNSENLSRKSHSDIEETESLDAADIVSSQFRGPSADRHMLVIDLDVPAALIPSSTPGHSHLYIEARMTWENYANVLDALAYAGIVEPGYVDASKNRGFTAVRLPWVRKHSGSPLTRPCRVKHVEF